MIPRSRLLRPGVAITLIAGTVLLTGCTATVPLKPSRDAANPACADLIVRLPAAVGALPERETNAQSTGAWGTPAAVLLHCGVAVPVPTTLPCLNVNGIDWIEDDSKAPIYRYTTYGRDPATELVIDSGKVSGSTVLVDLTQAVSAIPATRQCLGFEDLPIPTDGSPSVTAP
jgi:hypothetical protein